MDNESPNAKMVSFKVMRTPTNQDVLRAIDRCEIIKKLIEDLLLKTPIIAKVEIRDKIALAWKQIGEVSEELKKER